MRKIFKLSIFFIFTVLITLGVNAEAMNPVADAGQIIVTYKGECPSGESKKAIKGIKKIIAYEKMNSPVSYSSSPGVWSDGSIGAVDLHDSEESLNQAVEWQNSDKKWSNMYAKVATLCGVRVEDFTVNILVAE